ncbi:hypothetical protein Tco_0739259 [Tanacetum coccineum]
MLAPKGSTYNGIPTFENPMHLKKAQSEKPCFYEIPYDTSYLANRFAPDKEETLTLEQEKKLFKQTEIVSKKVYNELLRSFAKLENHSISLELALQQCQEQMKNDTICKQNGSTVFLKGREQYFKIQDLKAQLQDKNIAISELKKLIEKIKVTPHSWPQVRKSSFAKPYDVNALGPSRNRLKHVSFQSPGESVGSNDMVHNYYLEEAKKKAQLQKDKPLNTNPSVHQSARLPNTANGNQPKTRNFNQQPRNWPPYMNSRVSNRTVKIAEPPRNQKPFLKLKDLACPTCKKCIYSANHDECILKYLSKIPIGQKFSPNKSFVVYMKTTPPRSGLTWKPTGRIFTYVGLRWIPIRKSVETCYNMNDSASLLGTKTHNPNTVICANSSSLSACTSKASEPISSHVLTRHPKSFAPEKKSVRFSVLYLYKKRNLLYAEHYLARSVLTELEVQTTVLQPHSSRISRISRQRCQGILLASFQEDSKYEHVGQDIRSQDGKDNKTNKEKI